MSAVRFALELLEGALDFGRVLSSALGSRGAVRASIRGVEDTSGSTVVAEDVPDTELWGLAGFVYRPKAPSADGFCELLVIRATDERLPIASRDLRFIPPAVGEGETVVHALGRDGATQATLRLRADGTVVIEGSSIQLGTGATQAFVRGTEFLASLNIFAAALAADATNPAIAAAGSALKAYLDAGTAASTVVKGL